MSPGTPLKSARTMIRIVIMMQGVIGLMFLFQSVDVFARTSCVAELPPEYEENVTVWDDDESIMNSPFYVNRLNDTYAVDVATGHIDRVAERLINQFLKEDWGIYSQEQALIEVQLREVLSSLTEATTFARQNRDATESKIGQGLSDTEINRFIEKLDGSLPQLEMTEGSGDAGSRYFVDTESELVLFEPCDDGASYRLLLPVEELRQWRLLNHTLQTLVVKTIIPIREKNVNSLKQSVASWDSFFTGSYSQMPWESWINGKYIERPIFGPPDRQWIFLHPSFGVELGTGSFDDLKVDEALLVELLGHVWYRNADYKKYRGVSGAVVLRKNANPGLGVVAHIQKNWSVGVAWHRDLDGPQLFLSVDLFRYATTESTQYRAQAANHRNALQKLLP